MNGTGDGRVGSNKHLLLIGVITLCVNGTIGVCTLAYCLITQKELNVALFTAFVGIVNYILGVISGMFMKTSPTAGTTEPKPISETTKPAGKIEVSAQELETTETT